MQFEQQTTKFIVKNLDSFLGGGMAANGERKKHGPLFPNSIRCIVSGPSNCGKTNLIFQLLFDPNGINFENIYVFSKSLYQPKYKMLQKVLPKEIGYFPFDDNTSVIKPSEAKPNSVIIFDDIACEKHDNIRNFFTMGRHSNVDIFYLGQTYSYIPKQLIRDNSNLLILFKQDDMNLNHIYRDHVNTDMTFSKFKELCTNAWGDKFGFVVIDKECELKNGRYRVGFDRFLKVL